MTDEKKKPEEDEVTEEQLEDVAGGTWPKAAFVTSDTNPASSVEPRKTKPSETTAPDKTGDTAGG